MFWDSRTNRSEAASAAATGDDGQIFPTKALRKFLGSVTARESPVLLDLGPVVGSNVTFLGERLGCKIIVEDLFGDLERDASGGPSFAASLAGRVGGAPESVAGILCWNFFDYLEPAVSQALAQALVRRLRPDGVLLGFFTTVAAPDSRLSKYVIVDEDTLRQRPCSVRGRKQTALQNRDIIKLFDGLKVSESFLLKTNVREFLFRKPVQ